MKNPGFCAKNHISTQRRVNWLLFSSMMVLFFAAYWLHFVYSIRDLWYVFIGTVAVFLILVIVDWLGKEELIMDAE